MLRLVILMLSLNFKTDSRGKVLSRGGYLHNYVHFPKLGVPYLLGTEALPNPKVKQWAWNLFGLPQVTAQGIEVGAPYERENREVMFNAVNRGVGWFLDHYETILMAT